MYTGRNGWGYRGDGDGTLPRISSHLGMRSRLLETDERLPSARVPQPESCRDPRRPFPLYPSRAGSSCRLGHLEGISEDAMRAV